MESGRAAFCGQSSSSESEAFTCLHSQHLDWSATRPVCPTDMDDSRGLFGLRSEQHKQMI